VSPAVRWSVLHDAEENGMLSWGWFPLLVCRRITCIDGRAAPL